ncbi:MAG: hypothetical protein NTZ05_10540 [Chloroflexi bacterium]|nr:hypothetical protein [Chloroflexota bacterium]
MTQLRDESLDDLDRLFSRLEPAPLPADFTQRLLARTADMPQPKLARMQPLVFAYVVTLLLLGGAAYEAGRGISGGGVADLLWEAFSEPDLALTAPGEFLLGLAELAPWLELGAAVLLAAAALLAVRSLSRVWSLREELGAG